MSIEDAPFRATSSSAAGSTTTTSSSSRSARTDWWRKQGHRLDVVGLEQDAMPLRAKDKQWDRRTMKSKNLIKPVGWGVLASTLLLGAYFMVLTLVSGWEFARTQFATFWYFVLTLALGFGVQIGLYSYLRRITSHTDASGKVVTVSGTTSTGAMISCCAHYLTNVLPVLGSTGVVALVAQYQVGLFWVGLAFNLAGILYVGRKVIEAARHMALMAGRT